MGGHLTATLPSCAHGIGHGASFNGEDNQQALKHAEIAGQEGLARAISMFARHLWCAGRGRAIAHVLGRSLVVAGAVAISTLVWQETARTCSALLWWRKRAEKVRRLLCGRTVERMVAYSACLGVCMANPGYTEHRYIFYRIYTICFCFSVAI